MRAAGTCSSADRYRKGNARKGAATLVGTRIERDSMGEVEVPADAYYGASTQRAVDNFPISGLRFGRRFIWALGLLKGVWGGGNHQQGQLRQIRKMLDMLPMLPAEMQAELKAMPPELRAMLDALPPEGPARPDVASSNCAS